MSVDKSLTIFIPGLNSTRLSKKLLKQLNQVREVQGSETNSSELSSFNALFSKAKVSQIESLDSTSRYFELLAQTGSGNSVQLSSIIFSNVKNTLKEKVNYTNRWIYNISPVHLHPDMDKLVLSQDLTDQMTDDEAQLICQEINQLFNESEQDKGWELVFFSNMKWFLVSNFQLINQCLAEDMAGKPITIPKFELISSSNSEQLDSQQLESNFNYWIQTLNEIQMLLFSLTRTNSYTNIKSEKKLITQCNSLWLWGESFLSDKAQVANNNQINQNSWGKVTSDNYFVEQLCHYSKTHYQSKFSIDEILASDEKNSLIIVNELENAIKTKDPYMIFDILTQYECNLFKPLKKAILEGGLSVNILTNGKQSFFINKRRLKTWWIRTKETGTLLELME